MWLLMAFMFESYFFYFLGY